jgi:hypothetical protein
VWRWPITPIFLRLGVDAGRCAPPTIAGESMNGSAWCGGDRLLPQFRRGRLSARTFLLRRGWVFGSIGKGSGRKFCSDLFGPATRFSFLKASLKNLCSCCSSSHGSGESLAKLLLGWQWLRYGVIHLPRGIVEEPLCLGEVVSASRFSFFVARPLFALELGRPVMLFFLLNVYKFN